MPDDKTTDLVKVRCFYEGERSGSGVDPTTRGEQFAGLIKALAAVPRTFAYTIL